MHRIFLLRHFLEKNELQSQIFYLVNVTVTLTEVKFAAKRWMCQRATLRKQPDLHRANLPFSLMFSELKCKCKYVTVVTSTSCYYHEMLLTIDAAMF